MADTRAKAPYEKSQREITPNDWFAAVCRSKHHGRNPSDLKVASVLVRYSNTTHCYVWPTIETIADQTGLNKVKVSSTVNRLVNSGAISKMMIANLPDHIRSKVNRHGRGNVYVFNNTWAHDILQDHIRERREEPPQLKRARMARMVANIVNFSKRKQPG
ncbi:MAG: helix-turn-helix domain-containing protein [Rhizobiaceae bacterium]